MSDVGPATRSVRQMGAEAEHAVENVTPEQTAAEIARGDALFVDLREPGERTAETGALAGSLHAPRGMLEFYADPASVKVDAGHYAARIQMAARPLQSASVLPFGMLARGPHGPVELDIGTLSGGHVLHLAVAVCVFNDLLGEASRRGLRLHRLAVVAAGDYAAQPGLFHSTGITYRIEIAGDGLDGDLRTLVSDVERIAEIPHALRQGWLSDQVTYASAARAQALRHSLSQTPRAILRPAGRGTMAYYAFPGWRWRSAPGLLSCPDSRLDWRCYCCFTSVTGVARYWKGVFVSSMIRRCVLSGVLLAACAFAPAVTASAQGTLEPTAPENLRCPGRPGPRDGYHFEVQWQSFATFPAVDLEGTGRPRQVALDHACDLFVADMGGNQLVKFNPDGQQVAAWKMPERPVGDDGVEGVAVAPDGSVYVADRSQSKVYKLDASGKQVATWKSCDCEPGTPGWLVSPISVAVDGTGNNVYVLDSAANSVSRYSPDGKVQKIIGGDGDGPGQLSSPRQVGLDRQGNVYVADWGHDRIEKYSPDGNVLGQFGTSGADAGQIHLPTGVAVAADGSLYVSDSDNWRVMQLAPDGTPLEQYPACAGPDDCGVLAGSDIGQFSEHSSLSVDGQGNLYVADTGNDRIQRRIVVEVPNPPRASVLPSSEN